MKIGLAAGPIQYHLVVQLPNAGDSTKDPSIIWPDDRKTIDMGTISITSVVPDSSAAEKALAFDPTDLTDGIELPPKMLRPCCGFVADLLRIKLLMFNVVADVADFQTSYANT